MKHRRTAGFTLIELLVSIGVIAILIALILPAVQYAREAARRSTCKNNLKQMALAIHNYTDVHTMFPINTCFNSTLGPETKNRSWIQGVLPFIEQANLHEQIVQGGTLEQNKTVAEKKIDLFLCPTNAYSDLADFRADFPMDWSLALTNYKGCAGSNWEFGEYRNVSEGRRFPGSFDGLREGNGAVCAGRKWPVVTRMADLHDGSSSTFVIGEAVVEATRWSTWFHANHTAATCAIPLNYGLEPKDEHDWQNNLGFMSHHAGGGQFAFADGSVKFISENVDLLTYRALATVWGEEIVGDY